MPKHRGTQKGVSVHEAKIGYTNNHRKQMNLETQGIPDYSCGVCVCMCVCACVCARVCACVCVCGGLDCL
jgi:hypothetical protein